MNPGIDYSCGTANFDKETGIHFGVISMHDITQAWGDSAEPDYGEPTCPQCRNSVRPPEEGDESFDDSASDYYCPNCKAHWASEDTFGDEPNGWTLDDGEYKACDCLNYDVMVLKSPYFTYAQFCSPCVPGAGNLNNPRTEQDGVKCYCFGHDWFEEQKAPYTVYSIETGEEVLPVK